MGTDLKAEILARKARRKELIEESEKRMEHSTILLNESRRLMRIAMGHDNHKTDQNGEPTECGRGLSSRSQHRG
jgi:hypothetical protein